MYWILQPMMQLLINYAIHAYTHEANTHTIHLCMIFSLWPTAGRIQPVYPPCYADVCQTTEEHTVPSRSESEHSFSLSLCFFCWS